MSPITDEERKAAKDFKDNQGKEEDPLTLSLKEEERKKQEQEKKGGS